VTFLSPFTYYHLMTFDDMFDLQIEEAFGTCLGAVVARAQLRTAQAAKPIAVASEPSEPLHNGNVWEHVDLFDDPPTADVFVPPSAPPQTGRCADDADHPSAPRAKRARLSAVDGDQSAHPAATAATADDCGAAVPDPVQPPAQSAEQADRRMAAVFRRVRRRLERLRRYNGAARHREAREQAAAILGAAAAAGCRRIAGRAARLLGCAGYLPAAATQDLELQLDAAEAIWASSRCVV
jgi:hypothetical protein